MSMYITYTNNISPELESAVRPAPQDAMASPQIDSLKQALRAAEEAKLQGPLREEAEKKLQAAARWVSVGH